VAFGKTKRPIGVDVGSSAIKVIELKPISKGPQKYQLLTLGIEELTPQAIVDGAIMDSASVVEAIDRIFRESKMKNNDIATSLSGSSVIIRRISLPAMGEEELAESIKWEAEQYIPFDIEDVNLDYQILEGSTSEDPGSMDIILAAAKKDIINDYTSVITQAGKNPIVVDLDAFALQNAYEINYPERLAGNFALINIGASVMNITIYQRGSSIFWRDISIGGNQFTEALQKELNISYEQAENLKRGYEIDGIPSQKTLPIINAVSEAVVKEIQKTFDFVQTASLDRVVVSGGCTKISGFDQFISEKFSTPVEIMNPFRNISYNPKEFDPEYLNEVGPSFAIAVGLASREV
jgi:type IV pilus assembly protein PilM